MLCHFIYFFIFIHSTFCFCLEKALLLYLKMVLSKYKNSLSLCLSLSLSVCVCLIDRVPSGYVCLRCALTCPGVFIPSWWQQKQVRSHTASFLINQKSTLLVV